MSAYPTQLRRRARLLAGCALAAALANPAFGQAFQATPTVAQGSVSITQGQVITGGQRDSLSVFSNQAVIDWTPTDTATGGGAIAILPQGNELAFHGNGATYTVLNRIVPNDPGRAIQFDGHVLADTGYGSGSANIWFYSPGGIILGATSRFDVGSLVLTANAIDITNGLFGDGNTASQTGTIRFRGGTDSRSGVTIMPGAQINAAGNYVAIVAPRVNQGGGIVVEGSAALVAAESADVTIPISNGLFSISVQSGSNVAAAGDTTLTHSGTTETRDALLSGATRRVYLMAVPKNEAVTMLVSGNLGYSAAQQAQLGANGAIYLTTGQFANGDTPDFPDNGNIRITGGNFGGLTRASARNVTINTASSALSFSNGLDAYVVGGALDVSATGGRGLTVGGGANLSQFGGNGGAIGVTAGAGSTIQVGSLTLTSNVTGDVGDGTPGGTGTGGTQSLVADGGIITSSDFIRLNANGFGSDDGNNSDGGNGVGGTIAISALNGGRISTVSDLEARADGFGGEAGYGGGLGGSGTGGAVTMQIAGGGLIETGILTVTASGFGANSDGTNAGGNGSGGTLSLGLNAGTLRGIGFQLEASGRGNDGGSTGTGGTISLSSVNGSTIAGAGGNFELTANGAAGSDSNGPPVGNGTGGTITFINTASTFALGEGSLFATADGIAGQSDSFAAVTGRGGTISMTVNTVNPDDVEAEFRVSSLNLKADGYVEQPREDLRAFVPHGTSGTGVGGSALLHMTGGVMDANSVSLSASGTGDNGDYGNKAGTGFSGKAELRMAGGRLSAGSIDILAEAAGGDGAFGESGYGAAGNGGDANIGTNPFGAGAGAYITGTGGTLRADSLLVSANATGGFGGDGQTDSFQTPVSSAAGGSGRGATASVLTTNVSITVGSATVAAVGTGGDGGEVHYPTGYGIQTANAGAGGDGFGGIALLSLTGGAQSFENISVGADGNGGSGGEVTLAGSFDQTSTSAAGNGGAGTGGQTSIAFVNTTLTSVEGLGLEAAANGSGGLGGFGATGGSGGAATGGTASMTFNNSSAALYQLRIQAFADGGSGADGARLDGGAGGSATGGSATFTATNTAAVNIADAEQFDPLRLLATGNAGRGGDGGSQAAAGRGGNAGNGGHATGGSATITVGQGAQLVAPGVGGSENYPPSLFVSAVGGSGGFGGDGSDPGNTGGSGGNGGAATAGNAVINITGGRADFDSVYVEAAGIRGLGGQGGVGAPDPLTGIVTAAASGSDGYAVAGQFKLLVQDDGANAGGIRIDDLALDLRGDNEEGGLEIADTGANASGGIQLGELFAQSGNFNRTTNPVGNSDYLIRSTARRIAVDGNTQLTANGNVRFQFSGTGGLDVGGNVDARSLTRQVIIAHDQQTSPLTSSISAQNINITAANGVEARDGSLLNAHGSVDVFSSNSDVLVSNAIAINTIDIEAFGDVTVGSLTAGDSENTGSIFVRAGATEGFAPSNAYLNGNIHSTGNIDVFSGADTVANTGAQVIADRRLQVVAGDDILINAGALLRAANDAPPETGYGASDPLNQESQLALYAGQLYRFNPVDQELGSIVIDGTLEAPDRTLFMSAGAVSGTNSTLASGNLYVRLFNVPAGDQVPANDGGLLTGACLEGSVCLGQTNVTNIVRIGEVDYEPINLRLKGGIDGTDVLLRGQSVQLGETGASQSIRASDALTIESLSENLVLNGPLAITGGSTVARVASVRDIIGAEASIDGPATLDIYAANNITLGHLGANVIRTVGFDGAIVNGGGITLPGTIAIGDVRSGTDLVLNAGGNITLGTMAVTGQATLRALTGAIVVTTDADASNGTDATARSVTLNGLDGLNILQATATAGDIVLATGSGALTADRLNATGGISLSSGNGPVTVTTNIIAGGPVQASGDSINLRAIGDLRLDQGQAEGNITLASVNGGITLGNVEAGDTLTATAPGTLTVNGRVVGRTVGATSRDLVIGANGQLGDSEFTQSLSLTSTADRMFLGSATGTGYRIDEGEFRRIASRGSIGITSAPGTGRQDTAYNLLDPAGTNIVIGSMVFDGSQLGGEHTLTITSPQSIGFTGNVQFTNFNNDQTVSYKATNDISLAAETGLVTIKNGNGGLAGTLILDAQQVHAMSAKARSEIAGLQLNEVRQRLGTNDQLANDGGYFQANRIIVRIGNLLFIQNSGINSDDKNDKRGFTTNDLTIETGYGAGQVVIHGKIGNIVGEGIIPAAHLNGTFDPQSGFNTCLLQVACTVVTPPPPEPTYDFSNVLSAPRDQVKSEQDEDEKEEALQAGQARPDPIIQFVDAPKSRYDPLVDEPVTGAGNEDYWEPTIPTTPGPTP